MGSGARLVQLPGVVMDDIGGGGDHFFPLGNEFLNDVGDIFDRRIHGAIFWSMVLEISNTVVTKVS